jgi:hypothetical protein
LHERPYWRQKNVVQQNGGGPVFSIETLCEKCQVPLRLISLIKSEAIAKTILTAMHLPLEVPELHPARPPPQQYESEENWVN